MKLDGKVVIVTGASSGIGKDISYLMASHGAIVYAVARRVEKLEELALSAKDFSGKIIPHAADLTDKAEVEETIDYVYKDAGKIDVLVNNAGIMDDFSAIGDVDDDMLEKVFKINLYAPIYAMRKAVNIFLEQGYGNIINMSSEAGVFGARAGAVYTSSKHAIIGLTQNTAYMYALKNIRCNAICPGGVDTEIASGDFMKDVNKFGIERVMLGTATNPRSGKASEIAEIALFLASDASSFVNGQSIVADSGWSAY